MNRTEHSSTQTPLERFLQQTKDELIRTWKEDVSRLYNRLDALEPCSRLPPIPTPIRGKDFAREPNVAALMRAAVDYHNALIPEGRERYIQFPHGATDKKLNTDAKDSLEVIMIGKLGVNYGTLSWATASKTTHYTECEAVIQTAAASKDFAVFRQGSNFWGIRWLAEQKMKSKRRPSRVTKTAKDVQRSPGQYLTDNLGEHAAPATTADNNMIEKRSHREVSQMTGIPSQSVVEDCGAEHILAHQETVRAEAPGDGINENHGASEHEQAQIRRICQPCNGNELSSTPAVLKIVTKSGGGTSAGHKSARRHLNIPRKRPSQSRPVGKSSTATEAGDSGGEVNPIVKLRLRIRAAESFPSPKVRETSPTASGKIVAPRGTKDNISTTMTAPIKGFGNKGIIASRDHNQRPAVGSRDVLHNAIRGRRVARARGGLSKVARRGRGIVGRRRGMKTVINGNRRKCLGMQK